MIERVYSEEPMDKAGYTAAFDRSYSRFARLYDAAVKVLPIWRRWLAHAMPHIHGPRVLEVSFGTGFLLTQYAANHEVHGIDLNQKMVDLAKGNLRRQGLQAMLQQANVEAIPYGDGEFDCLVNTMALSGYPDAELALKEMTRVLRDRGTLVLIDVGYPSDGNWLGMCATRLWSALGDIIRDTPALLRRAGFDYSEREIGAFGSVHLYVCKLASPLKFSS